MYLEIRQPVQSTCFNFLLKIQERAFGKSYNLMDIEDLVDFQRKGVTTKCSADIRKATHIPAEIILEEIKI